MFNTTTGSGTPRCTCHLHSPGFSPFAWSVQCPLHPPTFTASANVTFKEKS